MQLVACAGIFDILLELFHKKMLADRPLSLAWKRTKWMKISLK